MEELVKKKNILIFFCKPGQVVIEWLGLNNTMTVFRVHVVKFQGFKPLLNGRCTIIALIMYDNVNDDIYTDEPNKKTG